MTILDDFNEGFLRDTDIIKNEIIGMLETLKTQAIESNKDTKIVDVRKNSFTWVINETISFLKSLDRFTYYTTDCCSILHKEGEEK